MTDLTQRPEWADDGTLIVRHDETGEFWIVNPTDFAVSEKGEWLFMGSAAYGPVSTPHLAGGLPAQSVANFTPISKVDARAEIAANKESA